MTSAERREFIAAARQELEELKRDIVIDRVLREAEIKQLVAEARAAQNAFFSSFLLMLKAFNPSQPRDDHGRWTSGGSGSGLGNFVTAHPFLAATAAISGALAAGPEVAAAALADEAVGALSAEEGGTLMNVLKTHFDGATLDSALEQHLGEAADDAYDSVSNAAQKVKDFLGGEPETYGVKKGNLWTQNGNVKFRMDIGNPGKMNGILNEPHFHFERLVGENWKSALSDDAHRYFGR